MQKTCPTCQKKLPEKQFVCDCGYDFMADDCPGCDKRVPEGTVICPHCQYDILEGVPAKTVKVKVAATVKVPVAVKSTPSSTGPIKPVATVKPKHEPEPYDDEEEEEKPKKRVPAGLRVSHTLALGHLGTPDTNYTELFWPKGQEVTDETLLSWAHDFRDAYREKCPGRKDCWLSNSAIYGWCKNDSQWHARRYDKAGQNDPLFENADRLLALLGGRDMGR